MFVKEIIFENHKSYTKLEAEDSKEFSGFVKIKFLNNQGYLKAGDIVYVNKDLIHKIEI